VTNLYDLMDSAYDAPEIHATSRAFGHVPIIDPNPRRGGKAAQEAEARAKRCAKPATLITIGHGPSPTSRSSMFLSPPGECRDSGSGNHER